MLIHRRPLAPSSVMQLHWFEVIVTTPLILLVCVHLGSYYTYSHTLLAANLTTWGFYDCQRDMNNGARGAMSKFKPSAAHWALKLDAWWTNSLMSLVPKLLLRHLPQQYTWVSTLHYFFSQLPNWIILSKNSVYALWPFFTPQHMTESLRKQGIADKYTFERPKPQPSPVILTTFTTISAVFSDPGRFKNIYPKFGYGSALNFDNPAQYVGSYFILFGILRYLYNVKDTIQIGCFACALFFRTSLR